MDTNPKRNIIAGAVLTDAYASRYRAAYDAERDAHAHTIVYGNTPADCDICAAYAYAIGYGYRFSYADAHTFADIYRAHANTIPD